MVMLGFFPVVSTELLVTNDSTSIGWNDVPSTKGISSTSGNILSFPLILVNLVIAAKELRSVQIMADKVH